MARVSTPRVNPEQEYETFEDLNSTAENVALAQQALIDIQALITQFEENGTSFTNQEILDGLITVDGSGSGLDADLLDGLQGSAYALAANLLTPVPAGAVFIDTVFDPSGLQAQIDVNTAKVSNVDHPLVETAVPLGAVFTDTIFDDSALQAQIDINSAKVSNVDHPLVESPVPVGAIFTDTIYDDTALQAVVALNTAKVSNVDHPLVETAVPVGAVFTDTLYDDSALAAEVALNTAKISNVDHPLVETAVPLGALFTDTIYDDSDVLKDSDVLTPITISNKLVTEDDLSGISAPADVLVDGDTLSPVNAGNKLITQSDVTGGGDMLKATYDAGNTGTVDNAELVNGLTVETAVPLGAIFTDTIYDDSVIQAEVDANTAKVSNVDHPLVETAVPVGAVFTDTVYDDTNVLKLSDALSTVSADNKLVTQVDLLDSFSPLSQYEDVVFWIDADQYDSIGNVADLSKSPLSMSTASTVILDEDVINGYKSFDFSGGSAFTIGGPLPVMTEGIFLVVTKCEQSAPSAPQSGCWKFGDNNNGNHYPYPGGTFYDDTGSDNRTTYTGVTDITQFHIYSCRSTSTGLKQVMQNGEVVYSLLSGNTFDNASQWSVGRSSPAINSLMTIPEVVILDVADLDSLQKMEGYLAHRYGITLVDGHPYKDAPPGNSSDNMLKTVYDTTESGIVDNAELVNGLTVETAVPAGAIFTDTVYDDTAIQAQVDANTTHTNSEHAYVENGFIDRFASTISFVDGTRTFSIIPTGASFEYFHDQQRFIVSSQDDLVISDVEGLHYIYYENGVLKETLTFVPEIITVYAFVAVIYWNATDKEIIYFGDERHGNVMDSQTHEYNHSTIGARFDSGLALLGITTNGNGNDASHAQFGVANGIIWDEDIKVEIADESPQELNPIAQIPIFYREGVNGYWRKVPATDYPITTTGSGRAAWNEFTGGSWQLTEVSNNDFVLVHYIATPDVNHPIIALMGQNVYLNRGSAEEGASAELLGLVLGSLEVLTPELVTIATVIYQTGDSKTNAVKSSIEETSNNQSYIDWRATGIVASGSASGASSWGAITGTLSIQTDLQLELDLKANVADVDTSAEVDAKITSGDVDLLDGQEGTYYLDFSNFTGVPTSLGGFGITGSDVLSTLQTVDGSGSGLDADLLDGQQGSAYLLASLKGANNGLAELDGTGKIPLEDLPTIPSTLAELTDVDVPTPLEGEVLTYVESSSKFESLPIPSQESSGNNIALFSFGTFSRS